jgi:hypothetical protein
MKTLPTPLTRRDMVKVSAGAALAAVVPAGTAACTREPAPSVVDSSGPAAALLGSTWDQAYPFALTELPYPASALEAAIDTQTMEIHHGRHHQAYLENLNAALESHASLHGRTLVELVAGWRGLPGEVRTAIRNHGGGHLNHALFWPSLSPQGGGEPTAPLADAISGRFGSFSGEFREQFSAGFHLASLAADGGGSLLTQLASWRSSPHPTRTIP